MRAVVPVTRVQIYGSSFSSGKNVPQDHKFFNQDGIFTLGFRA
jgi:hypothetical protein